MDKEITLRGIVRKILEAQSEVRDPYEFGDILGSTLRELKQLERQIKGKIIFYLGFVTDPEVVTWKASDIIKDLIDILGKGKDDEEKN